MAIASCLVDTNILLRMTRRSDPQHQVVDAALARLAGQGTVLHYTHQNVAELWNAMTRPVVRNGFGLSAAEAESEVRAIEAGMSFLPDSEAVYREWRRIVLQYGVLGVRDRQLLLDRAWQNRSMARGRLSSMCRSSPQLLPPYPSLTTP